MPDVWPVDFEATVSATVSAKAVRDRAQRDHKGRFISALAAMHAEQATAQQQQEAFAQGALIEWRSAPVVKDWRPAARLVGISSKAKPYSAMSWEQFCDAVAHLTTEQLLEQVKAMRASRE